MADNFIGDAWVVIRPDLSGFDTMLVAGVQDSIAKVQATVDAHPIQLRVEVDTSAALTQMAALRAAGAGMGGGGGGTTVLPAPGGDKGGTNWLALLGFGSAAGLFGMAGAFSTASFAGLGFEHVLTTALGLVGSLAGAISGGLLLALGALGVAMVGMGSDVLVLLEANQAVKALIKGIEAATSAPPAVKALAALAAGSLTLAQATLLYGKAAAQAQYQTAQLTIATDLFWLHSIGPAMVQIAALKDSLLGLANTYIPLIAAAAVRNFTIANQAIKPLFAFLAGPGTVIFKNLEALFAKNLPIAIHAFTQGIEILLKSINFLAPLTGGLTKAIDDFLTKVNSPAGFAKWEGIMTTLIGMFHTWWDFLKEVAKVIFDLFSQSLGLGTSIIKALTGMLKQLDAWLLSSSGKSAVHTLFAVHLQEVLALLGLLPTLLGAFGHLYLAIAPPLTLIVTGLATMVGWMLQIPVLGPIAAWGLALAFVARQLQLIGASKAVFGLFSGAGKTPAGGIPGAVIDGAKGVRVWGGPVEVVGLGGLSGGAGGKTAAADAQSAFNKLWGTGAPAAAAGGEAALAPAEIAALGGSVGIGTMAAAAATAAVPLLIAAGVFKWLSDQPGNVNALKDVPKGLGTGKTSNVSSFRVAGIPAMAAAHAQDVLDAAFAKTSADKLAASLAAIVKSWGTVAANGGPLVMDSARISDQYDLIKRALKGGPDALKHGWDDIKNSLGFTLRSGSNISAAMSDIANLTKDGKIKTRADLALYEASWNTIQTGAKNASGAQAAWALLLSKGQSDNAGSTAAFLRLWNQNVANGVTTPITMQQIANNLSDTAWGLSQQEGNILRGMTGAAIAAQLLSSKFAALTPNLGTPGATLHATPNAAGQFYYGTGGILKAGGWGMAGEGSAWELLHALPGGGVQVYPNRQSTAMAAAASTVTHQNITINVHGSNLSAANIAQELAWHARAN